MFSGPSCFKLGLMYEGAVVYLSLHFNQNLVSTAFTESG